jgi:hypothetical protein
MGLLRDSWDSGDRVSRLFVAGVVAKGLNGVAEVIGGTVLFLVSRDLLVGLLGGIAEWMLSDDPRNVIGRWILEWSKGEDLSEASISCWSGWPGGSGSITGPPSSSTKQPSPPTWSAKQPAPTSWMGPLAAGGAGPRQW